RQAAMPASENKAEGIINHGATSFRRPGRRDAVHPRISDRLSQMFRGMRVDESEDCALRSRGAEKVDVPRERTALCGFESVLRFRQIVRELLDHVLFIERLAFGL